MTLPVILRFVVEHILNRANKLKPTLIVGGIVCIAVFDLALTRLVSLPAVHDLMARIPAVRTDGPAPLSLTDMTADSSLTAAAAPSLQPKRAAVRRPPQAVPHPVVIARVVPKPVRARLQQTARRIEISPAIARTARPTNVGYLPARYTVTTTDNLAGPRVVAVERRRKNSLFAKAMPVIKKPWEWMKYVAAKLK
jgi:hypothetical protein